MDEAREEAARRRVDEVDRHFFICIGPDCIDSEQGERAWAQVKRRVAEAQKQYPNGVLYRSKVGCLRICTGGPTGVVYPEGTWYAGLDSETIDRVVDEHLLGGRPVEDHCIGTAKLAPETNSDD